MPVIPFRTIGQLIGNTLYYNTEPPANVRFPSEPAPPSGTRFISDGENVIPEVANRPIVALATNMAHMDYITQVLDRASFGYEQLVNVPAAATIGNTTPIEVPARICVNDGLDSATKVGIIQIVKLSSGAQPMLDDGTEVYVENILRPSPILANLGVDSSAWEGTTPADARTNFIASGTGIELVGQLDIKAFSRDTITISDPGSDWVNYANVGDIVEIYDTSPIAPATSNNGLYIIRAADHASHEYQIAPFQQEHHPIIFSTDYNNELNDLGGVVFGHVKLHYNGYFLGGAAGTPTGISVQTNVDLPDDEDYVLLGRYPRSLADRYQNILDSSLVQEKAIWGDGWSADGYIQHVIKQIIWGATPAQWDDLTGIMSLETLSAGTAGGLQSAYDYSKAGLGAPGDTMILADSAGPLVIELDDIGAYFEIKEGDDYFKIEKTASLTLDMSTSTFASSFKNTVTFQAGYSATATPQGAAGDLLLYGYGWSSETVALKSQWVQSEATPDDGSPWVEVWSGSCVTTYVIPPWLSGTVSGPTWLSGTVSGPEYLSGTVSNPLWLPGSVVAPTWMAGTVSGPKWLSGTITRPAWSTTITGVGTTFLSDFTPGSLVYIEGYGGTSINTIASDTVMYSFGFSGSPIGPANYTNAANVSVITGVGTSFLTDYATSPTITVEGVGTFTKSAINSDTELVVAEALSTTSFSGDLHTNADGAATVTGFGTSFLSHFSPTDAFIVDGVGTYTVDSVSSDTVLTLTTVPSSFSGANYTNADGEATIVGSATTFTSDFSATDTITIVGSGTYTVDTVSDDTHLLLTTAPPSGFSGSSYTNADGFLKVVGIGTTFLSDFSIGEDILINGVGIFTVSTPNSDTLLTLTSTHASTFSGSSYTDETGGATVTGIGTTFTSDFTGGDSILIDGVGTYEIASVSDDTHLLLLGILPSVYSGANYGLGTPNPSGLTTGDVDVWTGNALVVNSTTQDEESGGISVETGRSSGSSGWIYIETGIPDWYGVGAAVGSGSISIATGDANKPGGDGWSGDITMETGLVSASGSSYASGSVTILTGDNPDNITGDIWVEAGATATGTVGVVQIKGGDSSGSSDAGDVLITAGTSTSTGWSGTTTVSGGSSTSTGFTGHAKLVGGQGTTRAGGNATVQGGQSTGNIAGYAYLMGGESSDYTAGNAIVTGGYPATSSATAGDAIVESYDLGSAFWDSGNVFIRTGRCYTNSGDISIYTGGETYPDYSGAINIGTGDSWVSSGPLSLYTGDASDGDSGALGISTGDATATGAVSGALTLSTGDSYAVPGTITISAGSCFTNNSAYWVGADIILSSGTSSYTYGVAGNISLEPGGVYVGKATDRGVYLEQDRDNGRALCLRDVNQDTSITGFADLDIVRGAWGHKALIVRDIVQHYNQLSVNMTGGDGPSVVKSQWTKVGGDIYAFEQMHSNYFSDIYQSQSAILPGFVEVMDGFRAAGIYPILGVRDNYPNTSYYDIACEGLDETTAVLEGSGVMNFRITKPRLITDWKYYDVDRDKDERFVLTLLATDKVLTSNGAENGLLILYTDPDTEYVRHITVTGQINGGSPPASVLGAHYIVTTAGGSYGLKEIYYGGVSTWTKVDLFNGMIFYSEYALSGGTDTYLTDSTYKWDGSTWNFVAYAENSKLYDKGTRKLIHCIQNERLTDGVDVMRDYESFSVDVTGHMRVGMGVPVARGHGYPASIPRGMIEVGTQYSVPLMESPVWLPPAYGLRSWGEFHDEQRHGGRSHIRLVNPPTFSVQDTNTSAGYPSMGGVDAVTYLNYNTLLPTPSALSPKTMARELTGIGSGNTLRMSGANFTSFFGAYAPWASPTDSLPFSDYYVDLNATAPPVEDGRSELQTYIVDAVVSATDIQLNTAADDWGFTFASGYVYDAHFYVRDCVLRYIPPQGYESVEHPSYLHVRVPSGYSSYPDIGSGSGHNINGIDIIAYDPDDASQEVGECVWLRGYDLHNSGANRGSLLYVQGQYKNTGAGYGDAVVRFDLGAAIGTNTGEKGHVLYVQEADVVGSNKSTLCVSRETASAGAVFEALYGTSNRTMFLNKNSDGYGTLESPGVGAVSKTAGTWELGYVDTTEPATVKILHTGPMVLNDSNYGASVMFSPEDKSKTSVTFNQDTVAGDIRAVDGYGDRNSSTVFHQRTFPFQTGFQSYTKRVAPVSTFNFHAQHYAYEGKTDPASPYRRLDMGNSYLREAVAAGEDAQWIMVEIDVAPGMLFAGCTIPVNQQNSATGATIASQSYTCGIRRELVQIHPAVRGVNSNTSSSTVVEGFMPYETEADAVLGYTMKEMISYHNGAVTYGNSVQTRGVTSADTSTNNIPVLLDTALLVEPTSHMPCWGGNLTINSWDSGALIAPNTYWVTFTDPTSRFLGLHGHFGGWEAVPVGDLTTLDQPFMGDYLWIDDGDNKGLYPIYWVDTRGQLLGNVTVIAGTNAVTGAGGSSFTLEISEGDFITIAGETHEVSSILSDTSLLLTTSHVAGAAAQPYYRYSGRILIGSLTNLSGVTPTSGEKGWVPAIVNPGAKIFFQMHGRDDIGGVTAYNNMWPGVAFMWVLNDTAAGGYPHSPATAGSLGPRSPGFSYP